ncbi:major facilitator superfamily domain-containing protein 6-like protein [Dinothrombium tinctorium]|uniref:Major facilitator superfamily domain-containing protein 6-like protein n=1 Tax=Dinothrombium tinctorium TaxID=1965070 RepID=A0A3S3PIQ2_9ACAR|nr:major facilitator superfamily domain-containing protein 6-like protein [Dinothrombium tinctorium]RWS13371.1 major facilitator superfamily domain-containing protein 6-like protein [Dinothrombium tinctorium]RWS16020.1 major facilitator superfamily domain-containing protein 6-like protein [Dinothrombium tinctorium]
MSNYQAQTYPSNPFQNEINNAQESQYQHQYQAQPGNYGYTETITLDEANCDATPRSSEKGHIGQLQTQPLQTDLVQEILTDRDLLVSKAFYFFFYAAFGSLFPLMAVYFKQLGMNSVMAGFLIGIRPFIEFLSAPFWSSIANKFKKGKILLLASLLSWIIFTWSLSAVRPPAAACVVFNATHHILYPPYMEETDENYEVSITERQRRSLDESDNFIVETIEKRSLDKIRKMNPQIASQKKEFKYRSAYQRKIDARYRHKAPPNHIIGKSPISIEYTLNYNKDIHATYVSPPFSTVVYKWEEVQTVFFLLLLLVLLGEFFSAPAITLADQATLTYLKDNVDNYGRQRMFGSVGWGISMFFVGMALDNSTEFEWHPCGAHERERNYKTCFSVFVVLMALTLLVATRFQFEYENDDIADSGIQMNPYDNVPGPRPIFNTAPPINPPPGLHQDRKFEFLDRWKSAVFAQRTRELPEWVEVLRNFANLRYGAFLFVTWFMGAGIGLVFTFLFWHLQDLGGTPTLFGMASVVNHISEIIAYMYSLEFIRKVGHTKVLCIGLIGNIGRFLYIAWLENPWWVLPFELIQGVTHATVWAACCSYITQATPPTLRTSTQGVLQGLHHGLGRGCGAVIGGMFINRIGTPATFALYGVLSIIVFAFFVFVNYKRTDQGFRWFDDDADHNVVFEEGSGLAPHGVPSVPLTKVASKHNLAEQVNTDTVTRSNYFTADVTLDPSVHISTNYTNYTMQKELSSLTNILNPLSALESLKVWYSDLNPEKPMSDLKENIDSTECMNATGDHFLAKQENDDRSIKAPVLDTVLFCQQPNSVNTFSYEW